MQWQGMTEDEELEEALRLSVTEASGREPEDEYGNGEQSSDVDDASPSEEEEPSLPAATTAKVVHFGKPCWSPLDTLWTAFSEQLDTDIDDYREFVECSISKPRI